MENAGFDFAMGMARAAFVLVVIGVMLTAALNWVRDRVGAGRDDSDPPGGRSMLQVRTDALTGCQYLVTSDGYITPRLDAEGRHVCRH